MVRRFLGDLCTFIWGKSVTTIFAMLPAAVLGVILFFAGLELALSAQDYGQEKSDFYVMLVTAAFGIINMGVGFLAGIILYQLIQRKILRV